LIRKNDKINDNRGKSNEQSMKRERKEKRI